MGKPKVLGAYPGVAVDLDPAAVALVSDIYPDPKTRDRVLKLVAAAGANTLLAQVAGLNVPTAMGDLRLARVYWLVRAGMTIAEADEVIAKLFRVPIPTARRLNSAAFARYAGEAVIDGAVVKSAQDALDAASWTKTRWLIQLPIPLVRARIWQVLGIHTWPNPEHGDGSSWKFPDDTFQALRKEFQLGPKPPPK